MRNLIYRFVQFCFRLFFILIYRVEVLGQKNIPLKGSYIFASNHLSNLDPPLVGCFSKRYDLYYFAKEELFENKFFGAMLKLVKAFPVKRGKMDLKAMKSVFDILELGNSLLIFPEGTRRKNNEYTPKKGLGFIYLNSPISIKIIPVKVVNTDKFFKFKKLKLIFGEPFIIENQKDYFEISKIVLDKIEKLN
jgi:1-acyl-sn-glycerol-3-phosphate acyltransferase